MAASELDARTLAPSSSPAAGSPAAPGKRTLTEALPAQAPEVAGHGPAPPIQPGQDAVDPSVNGAQDHAEITLTDPVDILFDATQHTSVGSATVPLAAIAAALRQIPPDEQAQIVRVDLHATPNSASTITSAVRGGGLFLKVTDLSSPKSWLATQFKVILASGKSYFLSATPTVFRADVTSARRFELKQEIDGELSVIAVEQKEIGDLDQFTQHPEAAMDATHRELDAVTADLAATATKIDARMTELRAAVGRAPELDQTLTLGQATFDLGDLDGQIDAVYNQLVTAKRATGPDAAARVTALSRQLADLEARAFAQLAQDRYVLEQVLLGFERSHPDPAVTDTLAALTDLRAKQDFHASELRVAIQNELAGRAGRVAGATDELAAERADVAKRQPRVDALRAELAALDSAPVIEMLDIHGNRVAAPAAPPPAAPGLSAAATH